MTPPTDLGTEAPPRPPIDPRIRRRRIEVRRDEGRRRLRILVAAVSVVAAVGIGWGVARSPLLDVDRVRVEGAARTGDAAVLATLDVRRGDAMVDVGEVSAARRVEGLPWVKDASVRREWPATVVVSVTERRPVASARAAGGGWMLVDATGRLLERRALPLEGIPAIEGGTWAPRPGARLARPARGALAVAAAIPGDAVARIPVVAVLADGELELRLADDAQRPSGVVRFGPPAQVEDKLLAVLTVLDRVDVRGLARLDVRVPSAPVIAREP